MSISLTITMIVNAAKRSCELVLNLFMQAALLGAPTQPVQYTQYRQYPDDGDIYGADG